MRLPRDWLGPREELVPFGPGRVPATPTSRTDRRRGAAPPTNYADRRAPPSAEDFWGERSAAIHGALQAPADWAPADSAPADAGPTLPAGSVSGPIRLAPRRSAGGGGRRGRPRSCRRDGLRGRVDLSAPAAAPQPAGGSKAGVAAVLSGGVSEIFQLGLARIDATVGHEAATSRRNPPPREPGARRIVCQRRSRLTRHHAVSPARPAQPRSRWQSDHGPLECVPPGRDRYVRRNQRGTAQRTPTDTPPARPAPPRSASQSLPSRATVSSTGESGALGPIHSPNG